MSGVIAPRPGAVLSCTCAMTSHCCQAVLVVPEVMPPAEGVHRGVKDFPQGDVGRDWWMGGGGEMWGEEGIRVCVCVSMKTSG